MYVPPHLRNKSAKPESLTSKDDGSNLNNNKDDITVFKSEINEISKGISNMKVDKDIQTNKGFRSNLRNNAGYKNKSLNKSPKIRDTFVSPKINPHPKSVDIDINNSSKNKTNIRKKKCSGKKSAELNKLDSLQKKEPVTPVTDSRIILNSSPANLTMPKNNINQETQKVIPSSVRPNGTLRKERKVRPGFQSIEAREIYVVPQRRADYKSKSNDNTPPFQTKPSSSSSEIHSSQSAQSFLKDYLPQSGTIDWADDDFLAA
ncbi:hypothetical protein AYI70_g3622 [Smittium culicis]|uniref:WIBG Mago-binding domain-containing protein n=1 Tax=Smittium culicis TaxID=133412 RepID=A0A1R1Y364_9FUNG|nr:hypothetical protein AYI70_g3622 [Smittium culicis]